VLYIIIVIIIIIIIIIPRKNEVIIALEKSKTSTFQWLSHFAARKDNYHTKYMQAILASDTHLAHGQFLHEKAMKEAESLIYPVGTIKTKNFQNRRAEF
jgi:hypothetical protein